MTDWVFAGGQKLVFTGEFGEAHTSFSREPWAVGSDIPEQDQEVLIVTDRTGQRQTYDKALIAQAKHLRLRQLRSMTEDARKANERVLEMLRRAADEMGIDLNEEPPMDDYEALGYPETRVGFQLDGGVDAVSDIAGVMHRWIHSLTDATDKE